MWIYLRYLKLNYSLSERSDSLTSRNYFDPVFDGQNYAISFLCKRFKAGMCLTLKQLSFKAAQAERKVTALWG